MAEVSVAIDVRGIRDVLEQWTARGKNLRSAMAFVADEMVAETQENFETEGHGRWPDLADSTLASRRRRGKGAKMLQDSTHLAGSIDTDYSNEHAEAFTNVEHGKFHVSAAHGASTDARTRVPERDYFQFEEGKVERSAIDALTAEIVG